MVEKFSVQLTRMGVYKKMSGVTMNHRPVYSNSDNSNYLWKTRNGWVVGPNYTIDSIGIKSEASYSLLNYCVEHISSSMKVNARKTVVSGKNGMANG